MSKTPQELLAELRQKDPAIAAAMDQRVNEHIEEIDKEFEQYIGMCMRAASILSVISYDEAKAPEEKEDARKGAVVGHALVGAIHELITKMPPPMRAAVSTNFVRLLSQFMKNNEERLVAEIEKSQTQRREMLDRLSAQRAVDAPVAGLP